MEIRKLMLIYTDKVESIVINKLTKLTPISYTLMEQFSFFSTHLYIFVFCLDSILFSRQIKFLWKEVVSSRGIFRAGVDGSALTLHHCGYVLEKSSVGNG